MQEELVGRTEGCGRSNRWRTCVWKRFGGKQVDEKR